MKQAKVVGIIQARMGSARLPAKTLIDIAGQPLLAHVLDRVKASKTINELWVATTTNTEDQVVVEFAENRGFRAYRGSPDDVLDRFYQAALLSKADIIVRITADDPFKDPDVIDRIVGELRSVSGVDYASNTLIPTYPEGLDIEVFTFEALARAWREARLPSEREHVTPYIWKNPHLFQTRNIEHDKNLSSMRWTLDYEEDLRFTREIYARLYRGQVFLMSEILDLLRKEPALGEINSGIVRNAGYAASLQKESISHP